MNDSKMIELEIEKLEKQQERMTKKLNLLKKSKTVIEDSEKTKAKNLFYREVNELVAAANLKLFTKVKDLAQLTFDRKSNSIYLHEHSDDIVTASISKLRVEDKTIDQVSKWLDVIVEYADVVQYLLTFDHLDFKFDSIDFYIGLDRITAFFSSNDLSLNVSFFKDDTAHISMSNFIDDDFGRVEIDAGEIKYLVESNDAYYGFSLSASIEKDCRFNELDEMIDDAAAKLTNHGVRLA